MMEPIKKIGLKYIVVVIAILFVLPAGITISTWHATTNSSARTSASLETNSSHIDMPAFGQPLTPSLSHRNVLTGQTNSILSSLEANGVPGNEVYLPNFHLKTTMNSGHVQPLYPVAPAPMGIGDFGLKTQNGIVKAYNLTTRSFEGTVTMNNLSSLDMMTSARQTGGSVQLNTVLTNVTLFGITNYTYWTQNVLSYNNNFRQLTFNLNIWNFSSPTFAFPHNGIARGRGRVIANEVYITHGPTFSVTLPVTVNLYTNASVINGDSAVYFNYTLIDKGKVISGTFDTVLFNSTYAMPSSFSAPMPYYLVSGTTVTPTNFLLYDAELMIGGPGGGSTTDIYNINATMGLKYYNKTTSSVQNVPSAYNFGTDTGETSAGTNVWWMGPKAILNAGPSLLYGMWNVSLTPPHQFAGKISPSNSFMFISGGDVFNKSADAWSPLTLSGEYDFHVPYDHVSGQILLSYYKPVSFVISTGMEFRLVKDTHAGIYTPLYAYDNGQVKYLASYGNGSPSNPYIVTDAWGSFNSHTMTHLHGITRINSLFVELNDYLFPVFAGVLFWNVSAHVDMNNIPLLQITYGDQLQQTYKLPRPYNYLNYEFYGDSNVTLWNTEVGGYFTDSFLPYNIILFSSSNILIGNDRLYSSAISSSVGQTSGGSIAIIGGHSNTVWGNIFKVSKITHTGKGVLIYASTNLIYNNAFLHPLNFTALSPAIFTNTWNISKQPAYVVHCVNGYALSGSIIDTYYQGGNYWWNYNGKIPYNDNGLIGLGGDYVPLNYGMGIYSFGLDGNQAR